MNLHSDLRFALRAHTDSRRCAHGWLSHQSATPANASPPVAQPQWRSRGRAQLGQVVRPFTVRANATAIEFRFGDLVGVRVARDGSRVTRTRGAARSPLLAEAIWGAGLVLALALRDTYCLHASAVAHGEHCFLIVGPSGRGKSTLAARIAALPGWMRVVDDIAPIRAAGAGVRIFPHFPQLKLRPDPWPGVEMPRALPLAAVYVLNRGTLAQPAAMSLSTRRAALALVAGTVGARLFPPDLLARHLGVMAQFARSLPILALHVPDDCARLEVTASAVAALMLAGHTEQATK